MSAMRCNTSGEWLKSLINKHAPKGGKVKLRKVLAKYMGWSTANYVYDYERGDQELKPDQIEKIAEFFKEPVPSFNAVAPATAAPLPSPDAGGDFVSYPIVGTVAAGQFLDPSGDFENLGTFIGDRSKLFPNAKPMAWRVSGDSMNAAGFLDGAVAFGVDYVSAGQVLLNEMLVVVQQSRGDVVERTLKQVMVYPDRVEFIPQSLNPIHKPFVFGKGHKNTEIKILTIIHGSKNNY